VRLDLNMKTQGNKRRRANRELQSVPISSPTTPQQQQQHPRLLASSTQQQFMQSLRSCSEIEGFEFDREDRQQLNVLLQRYGPNLEKGELVSVLVSLGRLSQSGALTRTADQQQQATLLQEQIMLQSSTFTAQDFANVLVAGARMNWQWWDKKDVESDSTLAHLANALSAPQSVSDQHIGDIVWGLGATGLTFDREREKGGLKHALLAAFDAKAGRLNGYSLSSALWSLAKIGIKWNELKYGTRAETLPARLLLLSPDMSPQQSSKVIWALGTCGFKYDSDGGAALIISRLLSNVGGIKRSKMGGAVPASQTLVGLAKLGLTWDAMTAEVREELFEQVVRVCQSTNGRGITNAVWAIGTMGVPSSAVPEEVHGILLTGITRSADDCSAWALCNIVWGLAKMRFEWLYLPVAFRQMLMTTIVRLEKDMNSLDVALLIWSLGSIDTPLDALPPFFTEGLLRAAQRTLDTMKPEELSKTIWGLSSAELSWDSLPQAVRWNLNVNLRRVGESMAPQDVANCAYGLAILAFDTKEPSDAAFRGAHETLLNTIVNNRGKILARLRDDPTCQLQDQELEQIRIYSHYLQTMRYVTDTKRIPREFLEEGGGRINPQPLAGSRLQSRVTQGLIDALAAAAAEAPESVVQVTAEVSQFGGVFPVDAGIFNTPTGELIALIEVDGPHHYRPCDGRLRRKDRLKEAMYRKALPDCIFHRVRWDDANKVGSDIVGEELANLVLSNARSRDSGGGISTLFRSMSRNVETFFGWSMRSDWEE
jgi:hypothetical protein